MQKRGQEASAADATQPNIGAVQNNYIKGINNYGAQPENSNTSQSKLQQDNSQKKLEDINAELTDVQKKLIKKYRSLFRLYCDIITSMALMKHVFGPKAGGVCGTISSSIALYEKFGT